VLLVVHCYNDIERFSLIIEQSIRKLHQLCNDTGMYAYWFIVRIKQVLSFLSAAEIAYFADMLQYLM
jgi:hypothetical protein